MKRSQMNDVHTLAVLVENKAGVLARVAGLFARRGFNIESLAVAPTDERFSRITIVVDADSAPLDQIMKQLDKLIDVVDITELDTESSALREMVLVRLDVQDEAKVREVHQLVEGFSGSVIRVGGTRMMISLSSRPRELDEFISQLRPFGIEELQRTGAIAIPGID
ncbi:MAG: acetolactate synthase small subunit [Acidimicrobiia bacterium]|nr:acetolactate synthase small subunit [Acidimicrobiia bacterium]